MHTNVEAGIVNFWCNFLGASYLVFETGYLRVTWANMWQHAWPYFYMGAGDKAWFFMLAYVKCATNWTILQPYLFSVTNKYIMMC